ncbi:MAG TPA: sugar phosphate isomerase/epimerase [Roseiflexaceae bacterium]|nr:sugar phosphate isomerase/epimerase [Roseiflexaceae bacterium]
MITNPIALQMYTLREMTDADMRGTLRAVADLGYRAVEFASFGGLSAAELRAELAALGLQAIAVQVALTRLESELDAALADLRTLGAPYIVCPWLAPERRDAEGYHALAQSLNRIGKAAQEAGLQLCYHNHDFEFERYGAQTGYEILFGETDPMLVKAELDLYWVAFSGNDPVEFIRSLAGRIPLVHLKDMAAESRTFAEVGQGTLDFPSILAACDEAGAEWLIVEQDRSERSPLESVGMSLEYLRSLGRS